MRLPGHWAGRRGEERAERRAPDALAVGHRKEVAAIEERRSVLIVDDEPAVRALLRDVLEPAGLLLAEACDGSEALEAAWRERPDVVLLDVGLPRLSGVDVCIALKTNPEAPSVILVTGNAIDVDVDACGADGVVAKPFQPDTLLALVRDTVARRSERGEEALPALALPGPRSVR